MKWILLLIPMCLMAQVDIKKEKQSEFDEFGKLKNSLIRQGPSSGLNADFLDNLDSLRFVKFNERNNVGIGVTLPDALLHISTGSQYSDRLFDISTGSIRILEVMGSSITFGVPIFGNGANLTGISATSTSPWTRNSPYTFLTNSTDNVGIATGTPVERLHINAGLGEGLAIGPTAGLDPLGGGELGMVIKSTDGYIDAHIVSVMNNNDPRMFLRLTNTDIPWTFGAGNAERMRLNSSGNLGIGTTNPSQSLEVNGHILASSGVFNNTLTPYGGINGYLIYGYEIDSSTDDIGPTLTWIGISSFTASNLRGSKLLIGQASFTWDFSEASQLRVRVTRNGTVVREWQARSYDANTTNAFHQHWIESPSQSGSQQYILQVNYPAIASHRVFNSDFSVIEY